MVVLERPGKPYCFMAKQLRALLWRKAPGQTLDTGAVEKREKQAVCGQHAWAELDISCAHGIPEGSMLSIRIGAEQRQVMAAMLHKKTLKFSPGLCMKISVLVPEATAKLSLDPMEDHYHVRLGAKSGHPMSLALLMRAQEHGGAETGEKSPRNEDVCSARLENGT